MKFLILGGFHHGKLALIQIENDQFNEIESNPHTDTITSLETDNKQRYLFTGTKSGELILWKITSDQKFIVKFKYCDHNSAITSLYYSKKFKSIVSCSTDGSLKIYNYQNGILLKTLFHPDLLPITNVVLSASPLPCAIFYSKDNQTLYSYSINGQLLEVYKEETNILISPFISQDLSCLDYLVYANEKGEVLIRNSPGLTLKKKQLITTQNPILTALITKDQRFLITGCGNGDIAVVTDPRIKKLSP